MLNNLERVKGKKQRKKGVEPEMQGTAVWGAAGRRFPSVPPQSLFFVSSRNASFPTNDTKSGCLDLLNRG